MADLIAFWQAHQVSVSIVGTGLIDFLVEKNPLMKSNSLISFLLSFFKKSSGQV